MSTVSQLDAFKFEWPHERVIWIGFLKNEYGLFQKLSKDLLILIVKMIHEIVLQQVIFSYNQRKYLDASTSERKRHKVGIRFFTIYDRHSKPLLVDLTFNRMTCPSLDPIVHCEINRAPYTTPNRMTLAILDSRVVSFVLRPEQSNQRFVEQFGGTEYVTCAQRSKGNTILKIRLLKTTSIIETSSGRKLTISDLRRGQVVGVIVDPVVWFTHINTGMTLRAKHITCY